MDEFIGGVRLSSSVALSRGANARWPLPAFALGETGFVLALRGPGRFVGEAPLRIVYGEPVAVEPIRRGIRFHTQTGEARGQSEQPPDPCACWLFRQRHIPR